MDYFKRVARYTPTRFWVNNATRAQARMAIEAGAVGCTQNPTYLSKVIGTEDDGPELQTLLKELISKGGTTDEIISELQRQAIKKICDCFRGLYDSSGGKCGLVSIQANPFAENTKEILDNAAKMRELAPNALIKVPATRDGLEAIELLARDRVPVLATEVMSIDQVIAVCEIYERVSAALVNPGPFLFAHINGIFDEHVKAEVEKDGIDIAPDVYGQASLMLGRKIVGCLHDRSWKGIEYLAGGARGLHHFTNWVGVQGHVTINWKGTADKLLEQDSAVVDVFNAPSSYAMVDELAEKVPTFRKAFTPHSLSVDEFEDFGPVVRFRNQFEDGWTKVRKLIEG